jgi:hypothetical protein
MLTLRVPAHLETVLLGLVIVPALDPALQSIEVTSRMIEDVKGPEIRGRTIRARHPALIRKIHMTANEDEGRRRSGIRGTARTGKAGMKERLGRRRSEKRKRKRRCVYDVYLSRSLG